MRTLSIDIETYSEQDIRDTGVYRYARDPSFEILLFAYAFDNEDVSIIDLAQGEKLPEEIVKALFDVKVLKTAFNANFEITCLSWYLKKELPKEQWACTQVLVLNLGLPAPLEMAAKILKLGEEKEKLTTGKALIRYFCKPCAPSKANGGRTRNFPEHAPEKWQEFIEYCIRDVIAEREIRNRLKKFAPVARETDLWLLDQRINDIGVKLDMDLVNSAIILNNQFQERLVKEARELTGLDNPNSVAQLKKWIEDKTGIRVSSLNKEIVSELYKDVENEEVKRILKLRQLMGKTSVTKYQAMQKVCGLDGRVRGLLQFYGANRTGRWAGRLVQVQNLPQNKIPDLNIARTVVKDGDLELAEMFYNNLPSILSQLIRTAFIPSDGCEFLVADFSAIEARVISWMAGEKWRQEVFATHGKIYEASASQMFKIPLEKIVKGNPEYALRAKGKVAELSCGYQGGVVALKAMGADKMGLSDEELGVLITQWRGANKNIVKLWREVEKAAKKAIKDKTTVAFKKGIYFTYKSGMLFITLPSGRKLAYVKPGLEVESAFNRESIAYWGVDQMKKTWKKMNTYGGKLVENIVQAIARDCLAEAMLRLDEAGYRIVMHVHDEVILDNPLDHGSLDHACEIMGRPIDWAPGLLLKADGYKCNYYMKD